MTTDWDGTRVEPFRWLEPAHSVGEEGLDVESDALRQALAWQVAAELVRRHPKTLRLHMAYIHQYGPALMPMRMRPSGDWRPVHLMTWGKSMHISPVNGGWSNGRFNWLDVLLAPDRRTYVVEALERVAGLPSPQATPATVMQTIGARLVAAFMAKTALARTMEWVAVNGLVEDDDGTSPDTALFAAMPAVHADWKQRDPELEWATSRYWFLGPGGIGHNLSDPAAAVDFISGTLWTPDGKRRDLMAEYVKHGRHVDALVSRYLPPTQ